MRLTRGYYEDELLCSPATDNLQFERILNAVSLSLILLLKKEWLCAFGPCFYVPSAWEVNESKDWIKQAGLKKRKI